MKESNSSSDSPLCSFFQSLGPISGEGASALTCPIVVDRAPTHSLSSSPADNLHSCSSKRQKDRWGDSQEEEFLPSGRRRSYPAFAAATSKNTIVSPPSSPRSTATELSIYLKAQSFGLPIAPPSEKSRCSSRLSPQLPQRVASIESLRQH